ncbi:MAG: hypothetical protein IKG47_02670 [Oscillospiraceae bacterium]|nr:hypothetical protein [Oscillospiraceae bacterium]
MKIRKIIIGLLCFVLAGFIAFWIKELIDSRYPAYAIPEVHVTVDGVPIDCTMSECSWSFLTQDTYNVEFSGNLFDMDIPRNSVMGGEKLEISFSQPTDNMRVFRTKPYTYDFIVADDEMQIPFERGGYIYQVFAQFKRGYEVVFFYIVVE